MSSLRSLNPSGKGMFDGRRFKRFDIAMPYFITATNSVIHREIFATGAEYHTTKSNQRAVYLKDELNTSINHVQEHQTLIRELVEEILEQLEFFDDKVRKIAHGDSPAKEPMFWGKGNSYQGGLQKLEIIKQENPRTYGLFKKLEEKLVFYMKAMFMSVTKSDPQTFYVVRGIKREFDIDEDCKRFEEEKFQRIPLVQTIKILAELLKLKTDIFINICVDCSSRDVPEDWPIEAVNLSEGGIGAYLAKRFHLKDLVDVILFLPTVEKKVLFTGKVVSIREIPEDPLKELVGIEFILPDGKMQSLVRQEIQEIEMSPFFDNSVIKEA